MPTPPSERNLLFAVLALQNELAKPDDVLSAMHAWVAAKHRSLGELLVERGALDPEHRRLLDALIEAQLARHGTAEQSLVALDPSSHARRLLAQVADPDVQASLAALPAAADADRTISYRPTEAGPRYRILRPHAEGGLGEVFVAEDIELHREVALKEIKKEFAREEISRGRFVQEAEITGGLEHPGIVPVYGLGTYADGRPFYAMRFIKGDNLKAAIEKFHATEPVRFDSLEFRQLIGRFVDVCQAVAYAHSRGVLHRDLKPGNIMLGKFGETLVVDWGLAKVVGRPGADDPKTHDEATLRPSSGSGWAETALGSAVGTPGFMSPEQASGKLEALGPATDVYSLGATLYMLLTNRPPFEGTVAEVLERVRRGSWTPPRAVNAAVPAALDAICRKAMALQPEDRYWTPLELADDVEHWLGDEPVGAYAEPRGARVRRWIRKHPKRVTAAVVLLVATVVGLTAGMVLLSVMNGRIKAEQVVADENFRAARNAVDTYLTKVSEEDLLKEGRLLALRKKLLMSALPYYENFIKQRANDPKVRRDLAAAYLRAGRISIEIGLNPEGQKQAARAVELYGELLAESPGDKQVREDLAASYWSLGGVQYNTGQTKASVDNYSRAIELQELWWKEDPSDVELGRELAGDYSLRVLLKHDAGDEEGAAADTRRSVEILEKLLSTIPPEEKEEKDKTLDGLAWTYLRSGELRNCLKAIAISRSLKNDWALRGALNNAGNNLIVTGLPAKGEPLVRESEAIVRKAISEAPQSDFKLQYLEFPLGEVGESLFLQGKTLAARKALAEALDLKEELQRRGVSLGGNWLLNHAWYNYLLGRLEGETGDFARGLGRCEFARREVQELREADGGLGKDNPLVAAISAWVDETMSRFQFLSGKIAREELLARQRQILADRKALSKRGLKRGNYVGQYESEVGASAAVLAEHLLEAGKAEEALAVVNDVLPTQQRLVETDPPDNRNVANDDFRNNLFRQVWAELLARKGEALARTGKPVDASQAVHRAIEICEDIAKQEPCYLYDLAHHLTLASTLPGEDAQTLTDRAMKAIADFIASGFDNPYKLRTDPRLEPLRNREDFQKLLQDLEATVKEAKEP